ncbi:MAG: hypothetical protein ACJ71T_01295 [Actinomycetales bacterium]
MSSDAEPGPPVWLPLRNEFLPGEGHAWWRWFCPRPTVKILFYTDSNLVDFNAGLDFGVDHLRDILRTQSSFYAQFDIDLVNRHSGGHANHKLTAALLNGYDQLWIFGVLQCNQQGLPENELTAAEVADLRAWMDAGGGVLITGDHSNPRPPDADSALDPYLNLGRAIGRGVPRAGELRRWEGLPDASFVNNHNTQVPDFIRDINDLALQEDSLPQHLILSKYGVGWELPYFRRRYRPHPLFCGRSGPIDAFPDHMHEGQLEIPTNLPNAAWPVGPGGQPEPEVVASGTDKRNGRVYGVTTAYDGSLANVGRIVADSTWHHYFNVNLRGFALGSTVLARISEFYGNLAVWLSPPAKRSQMRCWIWWYLAVHPAVLMVTRHPYFVIGSTALDVLGREAGQCVITEMGWPWPVLEVERHKFPWPPEEVLFGSVISEYHAVFDRATEDRTHELPDREAIVRRGVERAVEAHVSDLTEALEAARGLPAVLAGKFDDYAGQRST